MRKIPLFIGVKEVRVELIQCESLPFRLYATVACSHTDMPSIKSRKSSHYSAFLSFDYKKKKNEKKKKKKNKKPHATWNILSELEHQQLRCEVFCFNC